MPARTYGGVISTAPCDTAPYDLLVLRKRLRAGCSMARYVAAEQTSRTSVVVVAAAILAWDSDMIGARKPVRAYIGAMK